MKLRDTTLLLSIAALVCNMSVQAAPAQGSVKDVVMTLAKSGYRVGAVMSLADFDQVQRQVPEPVDVESQQATNPAESILTRFTRQQPAFVVQRTQGGMRLVRQDTPSGVSRG